jgi:hypothetical protein
MPKVEDVLSAMGFARVVGQVPFGHFDHDADCAIGPYIAPEPAQQTASSTPDPTAVVYDEVEDPRTGEPLFRPRLRQ